MQQTINGKSVFVVEFDTMPVLPITGLTDEETLNERMYENIIKRVTGHNQNGLLGHSTKMWCMTYAEILTVAIEKGVITEPGKYGLYKDMANRRWEVFVINE